MLSGLGGGREMKTGTVYSDKRKHTAALFLHIICILTVMAAAVLVRIPSSWLADETEKVREGYTSESGIPYLTDMDSYYHVRLVRNYLDHGSLGNTVSEDGKPWDSRSYYPEGRSADYQPGIVWLTAGIRNLTGVSLDVLEYKLAAFVTALSALAAYLIGWRLKGKLSGLTAGLLIACAPVYAMRTCFGRFDTDMFVIFIELLMILFLTEALRAGSRRKMLLFSLCFGLSAVLFSLCWTPRNTLLFGGLTLAGGMLYVLFLCVTKQAGADMRDAHSFFRHDEVIALSACALLTVLALLITSGFTAFSSIPSFLGFISSTISAPVGEAVLPNLSGSISELNQARILPDHFWQIFTAYVPGSQPTVINGTGGFVAVLLSVSGFGQLFFACFPRSGRRVDPCQVRTCALYFCVLGVWSAGCCYLTRHGVRFIEHMSIPVALLAGSAVGAIRIRIPRMRGKSGLTLTEKRSSFLQARLFPALLCAAAVFPATVGTIQSVADIRPSVTDASCYAMRFIRETAKDPEAVIASWWDMGYYYESEADHPTLWDGATQNGKRGIMISKALTTGNPELSRRILLMLSSSGNAALELLLSNTDAKTAFETLWEALLLEKEDALELLQQRGFLSAAEAQEAESLLHPAHPKETYLVLTYTMTRQIAWYEHYANWDFTGNQPRPDITVYSYTPEGQPIFASETGQEYLDSVRGNETIWQLFFNARKTPCFTPEFEWHDGLEHVRVWLVEP